jgi:hypothetical protein
LKKRLKSFQKLIFRVADLKDVAVHVGCAQNVREGAQKIRAGYASFFESVFCLPYCAAASARAKGILRAKGAARLCVVPRAKSILARGKYPVRERQSV